MRILALLLLALFLASCGSSPRAPGRPTQAGPSPDDPRILRQCLGNLSALGVSYQSLPDRQFPNGCSATGSVKLVAVGIPVTNLGALKCGLALPFSLWVRESVQQAARAWLDGYVTKMESFGTFACRPVNNQAGNRLSEHGRANAVDIAAFQLADGRRITVKEGWNGPDANVRRFLRAIHGSACRRFNVVLGPDANALHHDHLHFDMGRGPYCR
ncbi:extensin family protein [Sphingomonas naphthae]|uniref:Extensin family protein n=1 Tax=Sphingomonas naphthae TaxID=1813468 RepID=A0ABY7TM74_9SPHN|nr:extensin family protein [Sphingomonas naphthae]WCT74091.1 extensin family protein [Sphingomonas naphthae]